MLLNNGGRGEDTGKIIARVQDDLKYLRAAAATRGDGKGSVDLQALDIVIARTEQGMNIIAERMMHSTHDQVTTLPAVASQKSLTKAMPNAQLKCAQQRFHNTSWMSPGQYCIVKHMSKLVAQPTHPLTPTMLSNYYGLPSEGPVTATPKRSGELLVGSTVEHLTTLPKINRINPLLTPPTISHNDAHKGLLSLIERGLIPPAAEIVLSPPPIYPRQAHLHTPKHHPLPKIAEGHFTQPPAFKLDTVKLDDQSTRPGSVKIPFATKSMSAMSESQDFYGRMSVQFLELPGSKHESEHYTHQEEEKKKLPNNYKIIIRNGCLVDSTKDFVHFKKEAQSRWNQILSVLKLVVDLCRNYVIPICILESNKLVRMCLEYELGLKISRDDLLSIMINKKQILDILSIPGQRYLGHGGVHAAATKIRATYLMFVERQKYLEHCRRKWAAGVVGTAWTLFMKLYNIKQKLKHVRCAHVASHRERGIELRRRWVQIQSSKRTIIHIPSQGHSQSVRATITNFQKEQSLQMGRLCDIRDPNVEVIYVSPVHLGGETIQYYHSLLAMCPEGQDSKQRVHFVTPEMLDVFKSHNMALSSVLVYSPKCLARIQRLITGKEAYIIPAVVCREDLAVADWLGLPLLGSEPEITQLYSSKPGARRLLRNAGVSIPPYEADIFSQEQLLECLASLIANHISISRWIFKLPEQVKGHGFAYCDVSKHLPCYEWVLRETMRYGPKWKKRWAQENALKKISSELPQMLAEHAHTADSTVYPLWTDFLKHFYEVGGLIEGSPPSDSVTPVAVELFIEPTGRVKVLSTLDQICSHPYEVWGGSVPQLSLPHSTLMDAVDGVAGACKARGVLGHLSIDFITFIDPKSMTQKLWCVDLDFGYSDTLALHQLMCHVTGMQLDIPSGALVFDAGDNEVERSHYFAVLAPHIYHTNLSLVYLSIFFQMCKAHFIGYDIKEKQGTLFSLAKDRNYLGMICLQKSLIKAVNSASSNLSIIHQEISTPTMQGSSNFKPVIKELDKVIELINSNDII